jgi:flagellar assembly factor FliW
MDFGTTRFGRIRIQPKDLLTFPQGLVGLPDCRRWVLLADAANDQLAWLQSVDRPELALAVASPRRLVPGQRFRVARQQLSCIELAEPQAAEVLVVLSRSERGLTANLRAPIVINVVRRLGCQAIVNGDSSLSHALQGPFDLVRRSA